MNALVPNMPQLEFILFEAAGTTELSIGFKGAMEVEEWKFR